jgi:hypothetical protein
MLVLMLVRKSSWLRFNGLVNKLVIEWLRSLRV